MNDFMPENSATQKKLRKTQSMKTDLNRKSEQAGYKQRNRISNLNYFHKENPKSRWFH